jgi:catechol 2,3-dioxygenase-like lactoylglutathione lyase family enzyme
LNVTRFIDGQTHQQQYGMEHIAIDTDDMDAVVEKLKGAGARILEETKVGGGRRVCFFEGPEGVVLEVLEILK